MTLVRKVHAAPPPGAEILEFVMSDATLDRVGDVIEPDGWTLKTFESNPIALFNHNPNFPIGRWASVRVEKGRLVGKLQLAEPGTSDRLDEIRRLVAQGILRATSVGFEPLESEPLNKTGGRGRRYKKQDLVETSIVSIPANPSAVTIARSLDISDDTLELVFGGTADGGELERRSVSPPGSAPPPLARKSSPMETTLSQRIQDAQTNINADRDALAVLLGQAEPDPVKIDELNGRLESRHAELAQYRRSEVLLGQSTIPAAPQQKAAPLQGQLYPPGVPIPARPFATPRAPDIKPEDLWVKAAVAYVTSHGTGKDLDTVLQMRGYAEHEGLSLFTKAAVAGATTTTAGWAAELFQTGTQAFLESLNQRSVYPALAAAGGGRLTFGPQQGQIKIPSRASTPSISGSFVGEGAPIPVRKLGLTSITLAPKKMGVISVMSREIVRYSNPAIEPLVRQEIVKDTAFTVDSLLLDATAGDAIRPAGLLWNTFAGAAITPLTATAGGGYAAMLGDLRKLQAPFDAANAGRRMVLLVNPAQQLSFTMTPGPDGSMNWTGGILAAYQVISSTAIPVGRVIMIDAEDFVTATGDVPEFEVSDQALLHMEDTTPLQIVTGAQGAGVVAAPSQSMFQTAQIAVRMLLDISWAMRRAGMVQFINGVTW